MTATHWGALLDYIATESNAFGFSHFGVSDIDLSSQKQAYIDWLNKQYHGDMEWIANNQDKRLHPENLVTGTCRVLMFKMHYLPENTEQIHTLKDGNKAYISRYALGRDYHKLIRKRLAKLGKMIEDFARQQGLHPQPLSRAFVDSAPVMEKPLAEKAGLGWTGKHSLILHKEDGSWFFLGELFTNLALPITTDSISNACGTCEACMHICPTDAFPKPYVLDARRCISYLTIEYKGVIPVEYREPMGNRIFGCDDCQIICPWNKLAKHTNENDFSPRHQLQNQELLELFNWDEATFLQKTEGSAIRRSGYQSWRRNLAIALGNAPKDLRVTNALTSALEDADTIVAEHIHWALERQASSRRRIRKIKNPERSQR